MNETEDSAHEPPKKRKSGIPTGNAGEYLVMGELLRRGFDAQLADRNTKDYDILVRWEDGPFTPVQVKTVRSPPWYVSQRMFADGLLDQVTIYVLLGREDGRKPVRFFLAPNREVAEHANYPSGWRKNGFMKLKALEPYEGNWRILK